MAIPDPNTTNWVPIWNPVSVGPTGPTGPTGPQGIPGATAPHHVTHEPGGSDALVDAAWLGLVNQFTRAQRISNQTGDIPRITFSDLTQAVNARVWEINLLSSNFHIWGLNDAENTIIAAMTIERTGRVIVDLIQTKGVEFPPAQSPSSNPNTLDDYEEGTFVPLMTSSGGGSATYSSQEGYYTKIGNTVTFVLYLGIAVNSFGVGYAYITGLPFVAAGHYGHVSFGGYALGTSISWIGGNIEPNSNYFHMPASPASGGTFNGVIQTDSFVNGSSIRVTGTYRTP